MIIAHGSYLVIRQGKPFLAYPPNGERIGPKPYPSRTSSERGPIVTI